MSHIEITVGENQSVTVEGGESTATALAAASEAVLASNAIQAAARYFTSQAAGEAGSTTGQFFSHPDGSGGIVYREKTGGGSIIIGNAATASQIEAVADDVAEQTTRIDHVDDALVAAIAQRPVYVEQRYAAFFGRGKLDAEASATVTEQTITNAPLAAGATTINVGDLTKFDAGGTVAIDHLDGTIGIYPVVQIGSGLVIDPPLEKGVASGGKVERVWWDYAHPGKRSMRALAQHIVAGTEHEFAMPQGAATIHLPVIESGDLIAIGSTLTPQTASNLGHDGTLAKPIRFPGPCILIESISNNEGAETALFPVVQPGPQLCRLRLFVNLVSVTYTARVFDQDGRLLSSYVIPAKRVVRDYEFAFNSRSATELKVQVVATSGATGGGSESVVWAGVSVFPAPASNGLVIAKQDARIGVGVDSWASGDLGTTAERLGLTDAIEELLPDATVINLGVGGNDLPTFLARWDADVLTADLDYLIVNVGTNDSYSPSSVTFGGFTGAVPDLTARNNMRGYYRDLLGRADRAGIRLILVGPPALAQSDPSVPLDLDGVTPLPEWALNDRAGTYARDLEADAAAAGGADAGTPVEIAFDFTAAPASDEVLVRRFFTVATTFANDFAGSYGIAGIGPASTWTARIIKNGADVGTIVVATDGSVTFTTTGGTLSFAAGDRLDIVAPASADGTIAGAGFTLAGTQ